MNTTLGTSPAGALGCTLLVSNDAATIQQLADSMQQLALFPRVSVDVSAALELLTRQKFEAVVVDFRLGEQAKTVVQQVRLSPSNRTAVLFAIAGSGAESAVVSKVGSTFVLERPLSAVLINRTFKAAYGLIVRERRRYFRCPIAIPVTIRRRSMQDVRCQTVNISEGGMAISTSVPFTPDLRAITQFELPGHLHPFAPESAFCWYDKRGFVGLRFDSFPTQQKSDLQEWLSRKLEESLPEAVAERFRQAKGS
jgi:ActR/RegA family two-component response regulator